MKSINTMKFVTEYSKQMTITLAKINYADTYDEAKKIANYAMGLVDGMTLFTNEMICTENNDFTAEMSDVEDAWRKDIYQTLIENAKRTKQSADEIVKLIVHRDEYLH